MMKCMRKEYFNEVKENFRQLGKTHNPLILKYYKRVMREIKGYDTGIHWVANNYLAKYYQDENNHEMVYKYQMIAIEKCTDEQRAMSFWCIGESYYETKDYINATLAFKESARIYKKTGCIQYRLINIFNYIRTYNNPNKYIECIIFVYQRKLDCTNEFFTSFDNDAKDYLYDMSLYLIKLYMRENNMLAAYKFIKKINDKEIVSLLKNEIS